MFFSLTAAFRLDFGFQSLSAANMQNIDWNILRDKNTRITMQIGKIELKFIEIG